MHPVPVFDTLTFEHTDSSDVELTCSNPALPVDATNLVHRAATLFLKTAGLESGVRIHLEKRVPLAAGLGGGSSNAATTLLALNDLFSRPLSDPDLRYLSSSLGSDVAFFLQPAPALATGRGEQVQPVEPLPGLRDLWVLLIHPGFGVSTAWAYQALARYPDVLRGAPGQARKLVDALRQSTIEAAAPLFYNALEAPVLHKYPILQLHQEWLRAHGATVTLMSGSGSTTFALFTSGPAANEAAHSFKARFGEACWTAVAPLST
jgi:4-diphosphocytidyl-2-C-methyl-D-erythritol kinase